MRVAHGLSAGCGGLPRIVRKGIHLAKASLFCGALVVTAAACERHSTTNTRSVASAAPALSSPTRLAPYPRARWRLAPNSVLENTVLWASHIVVRHEKSSARAPFGPPTWQPFDEAPKRTKQEAFAIAREVREKANANPSEFAVLASRFSDDITTKDRAGSIGGQTAARLKLWAPILDALAALKPGQVSEVVETEFGYHVLIRRSPPETRNVAARRIVVGYDGAGDGLVTRQARSRKEAFALAERLRAAASQPGASFEQLIREHSEHRDVEQQGDIGQWSTAEPSTFPREIELLSTMRIGDISTVIDSMSGAEILQRTEDEVPRPAYASAAIRMAYSAEAPETDETSKAKTAKRVTTMLHALKRDPSLFSAFQHEYCCLKPERWTAGRGDPAVSRFLDTVAVGEIAGSYLERPFELVIYKRLDPRDPSLSEPTKHDLPSPNAPDIEELVKTTTRDGLAKYVKNLKETSSAFLSLSGTRKERFGVIHDSLAEKLGTREANARVEALTAALGDIKELLGDDDFTRYRRFIDQDITDRVMRIQVPE
jgi:hypothetical protein